MPRDFRLAADFFDHPKALLLQDLHGADGVLGILRLWAYAAQYAPDGHLALATETTIADIVWRSGVTMRGECPPADLVKDLLMIGFLEVCPDGCGYVIHNWTERQSWLIGAEEREKAASKAGKASAEKRRTASVRTDRQRTV